MDLSRARSRLEGDLAETQRTLAAIRERLAVPQSESGGELSLADQHPADAATETELRELDMTRERMLAARASRISDALARVASGKYGQCVVCGQPIPDERLEAVPDTPYCVRDAEREERKP